MLRRTMGADQGGEQDGDEALEQVALVLDVIKFHRSEFFDPAFPRKTTFEHVLHVVRTQPQSSKDASSLLGDPGKCDAGSTRSVDRGDAPPRGARTESVFASAQGASTSFGSFLHDDETTVQPLDLTELDWLPPLWIAGRAECEVGKPCVGRLPAGRVGGVP
ncbi:hypothetical protein HD554DRAFT_1172281 [Boletus coccyginus]|nr:hypothetical protein HD554DRAFT_1172281 [Boletus coccyginus]